MYSHPTYETRTKQLREAYAARRDALQQVYWAGSLGAQAGVEYLPAAEPDLADLISTHSIHVAPYGAIVYARIGEREVGVKYSATGGDKAKAVRLAVREVLRLVGVVS